MASKKIKLTSQTAWETQKDLNDNFTDIDERLDAVPTKTSDLTNDGEDGTSPFATEEYVDENGGKIDSISVNGTPQTIDANKNVDITVPADTGATSVDETGSGNAYTGSSYDSATRKITFTKGETFQTATDNSLNTNNKTVSGAINEVNAVAKAANQAKGFASYSALITALNSASATEYNVGQSFYVQTREVPDLWVISIESSSVAYTYVDDATFVAATGAVGGQQVGYYKLAQLETQKVDLTNYVQKTTTIAGVDLQDNITKAELLTALNVADGAEANVQSDWNQTDATADDYIKNKPTIPEDTGATSVEVTGNGNVLDNATYDSTTRKITFTKNTVALTQHQNIKKLDTTATTAQTPNANELINRDGVITLHKISKTGTLADAIDDATHRLVTDTEKATWNAKQDVVANLTFTDDDSRWSAVDANGFYTLTIVSSLTPEKVFKNGSNNLKQEVMATANYDGTNIYIITDTKFSGSVSVKQEALNGFTKQSNTQ